MTYRTPQESFWAGEFGKDYISRNMDSGLAAANFALFSRILARAGATASILEFGANVGMNLRVLRQLLPHARLRGVEINPDAAAKLRLLEGIEVTEGSIYDFEPEDKWDLVFSKGVLIHLAPEMLHVAYGKMADCSARHVLICEYYSPVPMSLDYRGHEGKLFKRDFAGEFLAEHPNFRLVDYGFAYRNDPVFPQDDCTWFLLEKTIV